MIILKVALLIISVLFMLVCLIAMIKNDVTYRNSNIIINAIFDYHKDVIKKAVENGTIIYGVKYEVDYSDMKDYDDMLKQIFDWGYKNVLPEDKFEIIKPYIHK